MGERKQAKGKVGRRPTGQTTHRAPPTPAAPATCRTSHPSGTTVAGIASAAGVQPPGTCLAGTISAVGGSVQGCRGRSPRRNKLWDSPFPGGEERSASAGGGMGAAKQAKGGVGRRPAGQATLWAPPTPAAPATCRASHPLGAANTHRPGDLPDKPPIGHPQRRFSPCRFRLGHGDARGEAPCMKITLISPFPPGRGSGGWGQQSKLKAG